MQIAQKGHSVVAKTTAVHDALIPEKFVTQNVIVLSARTKWVVMKDQAAEEEVGIVLGYFKAVLQVNHWLCEVS